MAAICMFTPLILIVFVFNEGLLVISLLHS